MLLGFAIFSPLLLLGYDPCITDKKLIRDAVKVSLVDLLFVLNGYVFGWMFGLGLFLLGILVAAFILNIYFEEEWHLYYHL